MLEYDFFVSRVRKKLIFHQLSDLTFLIVGILYACLFRHMVIHIRC